MVSFVNESLEIKRKVKLLAKQIFIPKGRDGGKGRGGMRLPSLT